MAARPNGQHGGGSLRGRVVGLVFGALCVVVSPLSSQAGEASIGVDSIEVLARGGRVEEARRALLDWWETERDSASRRERQHGIWLRAVLTVDPGQAALDLEQLVVEFPGGPYSDRALLRLAQFAEMEGDTARTEAYLRALDRDYPESIAREEAQAWLARTVEGAVRAPSRASGQSATAASYTVQIGAFSSPGRAADLAVQVREAGFEVRLVRIAGSDLVRVRVGRFDSAPAAEAAQDRLAGIGVEGMVQDDARREVPVRRPPL